MWLACTTSSFVCYSLGYPVQVDHLSGKPGNVREFDICQGNVRVLLKIRELSGKKSCQGKVA